MGFIYFETPCMTKKGTGKQRDNECC